MNNDLIFYQILSTTCNKLVLMPGIPRNSEKLEQTFGLSAYIALPINLPFVC